MRPVAIALLGTVALILMLLNLYGMYKLFAIFVEVHNDQQQLDKRLKDEDKIINEASTSTPEVSTTKHHRLKYQFNRTTGTWERRPVETTTPRQHTTTVYHRPKKPSTKYYVHHETTPPTTLPPTTTTEWMPRRHPFVTPEEESAVQTTTRLPFRISTVRITTHRDDLVETGHHHRKHHHSHITTTLPPETSIYPHRNHHSNLDEGQRGHHRADVTTERPRSTAIVHPNLLPEIIDDDDEIVIEREDLIGEKKGGYDVIPPIHIGRPSLPASSTPGNQRIVIEEEGIRVRPVDDDDIIPVTSHPPTTTTLTADEDGGMTVVTALMDIGRGEWFEYRRPLEKYHSYMENVLSLKVNMVIFTDKSSVDFVYKYRKEMGLMHKTKVYNITLDDLPLARYHFHAQKIIEDELKTPDLWKKWDPQMQKHPEAKSPEYDILVNSKTFFLYNATLEDPFASDWFVWLDAGYGHGDQTPFPVDNNWRPKFPRRKISVIKVTPEHDQMSNWSLDKLYRQNWSVISGGFLAGERHAIGQLHTLVHRKFVELIDMDRVDDDQTVLVLVIQSHPHLFNVVVGDWFDAFSKFPSIK